MRWLITAVCMHACSRPPPSDGEDYRPPGPPDGAPTDSTPLTDAPAADRIRVASFNIEFVGPAGSTQYDALRAVIARIDADVLGINEVGGGEEGLFTKLVAGLGYEAVVPLINPFGGQRNAVLARLPVLDMTVWSSPALSGDTQANDVTRLPVTVVVQTPWGTSLAVTTEHCKAGFGDIDGFRRTVDARRTLQAALATDADAQLVMGDFNEDLDALTQSPDPAIVFTVLPSGAPVSYQLGTDLAQELPSGISADPFAQLLAAGLQPVDAAQRDGRTETRDSGRRLDYIWRDTALVLLGSEVYDSRDEDLDGGLPKAGAALPRETSRDASDHLPVIVDFGPR